MYGTGREDPALSKGTARTTRSRGTRTTRGSPVATRAVATTIPLPSHLPRDRSPGPWSRVGRTSSPTARYWFRYLYPTPHPPFLVPSPGVCRTSDPTLRKVEKSSEQQPEPLFGPSMVRPESRHWVRTPGSGVRSEEPTVYPTTTTGTSRAIGPAGTGSPLRTTCTTSTRRSRIPTVSFKLEGGGDSGCTEGRDGRNLESRREEERP